MCFASGVANEEVMTCRKCNLNTDYEFIYIEISEIKSRQ